MIVHIEHRTRYRYSEPVFLQPHLLRFRPRLSAHQRLLDFSLTISPEPDGMGHCRDLEGNHYLQSWFSGTHSELLIDLDLKVESLSFNPFSFLVEPKSISGEDALYPENPVLAPYIILAHLSESLEKWAQDILDKTDGSVLGFYSQLCAAIAEQHNHTTRHEARIWSPEQTFELKKGSCRDLAWLCMLVLGRYGIASRFVSGYAIGDEITGHELHAWVEALVPGGGWIAADPSAGILCNERYIAVAQSHDPYSTLPVQGKFNGEASAKLETEVNISQLN